MASSESGSSSRDDDEYDDEVPSSDGGDDEDDDELEAAEEDPQQKGQDVTRGDAMATRGEPQDNAESAKDEEEESEDADLDDDDQEEPEEPEDQKKQQEPSSSRQKKKTAAFRLDLDETAQDYNAQLARRGVIYLPSVPPSMTPTILRQLLEPHGEITRLYLKPNYNNNKSNNAKKKKNKRTCYAEGWVEFAKRSTAKRVALCLHQTTITNRPRSIMCGDLWNMKYLGHRFKWEILTETIAYERRVREQRLRLETMQARKEAVQYKEWLSQNETLDLIAQRRRERKQREDDTNNDDGHNNNKKSSYPMGTKTTKSTDDDTNKNYTTTNAANGKRKRTTKRHGGGERQPLDERGPERATQKVVLESLL